MNPTSVRATLSRHERCTMAVAIVVALVAPAVRAQVDAQQLRINDDSSWSLDLSGQLLEWFESSQTVFGLSLYQTHSYSAAIRCLFQVTSAAAPMVRPSLISKLRSGWPSPI